MIEPELVVEDWEIWYSYSTYLRSEVGDLAEAARRLVGSSLAECAVLRDGRCYWAGAKGVETGRVLLNDRKRDVPLATATFPSGVEGQAAAGLRQAAEFMVHERFLFGVDASPFPDHVRAFLGPVLFHGKGGEAVVWPIVKLYANAVVHVQLRRREAEQEIDLGDFIREKVNLSQREFERVYAPPAYASLITQAYYAQQELSLRARFALHRDQAGHDTAVAGATTLVEHDGTIYKVAPVSKYPGPEHLDRFANDLASVVGYVVAGAPSAGPFTRRRAWEGAVGGHWRGRPHIHLLRFADQSASAKENEERHAGALSDLLVRARNAGYPLPRNSGVGDRQGVYLGSAATLWVHTTGSISEDADGASEPVVFRDQSIVEALEYGYIVHRHLQERISRTDTVDQVLGVRQELLELKLRLAESSHYGAILSILSDAWKAWGLDQIRQGVEQRLAVREAAQALREARQTNRWAALLTTVFGVGAIPPLAEDVLGPMWTLFGWTRPASDAGFKVLLVLLVSVAVGALLYLARTFYVNGSNSSR